MITDTRAIKFVNEEIRPFAEEIRALKYKIDAALVSWNNTVSSLVPNDSNIIDDGRTGEGVSILTGADINGFVTLLTNIQTQLNQVGVTNKVDKPCVRNLGNTL